MGIKGIFFQSLFYYLRISCINIVCFIKSLHISYLKLLPISVPFLHLGFKLHFCEPAEFTYYSIHVYIRTALQRPYPWRSLTLFPTAIINCQYLPNYSCDVLSPFPAHAAFFILCAGLMNTVKLMWDHMWNVTVMVIKYYFPADVHVFFTHQTDYITQNLRF